MAVTTEYSTEYAASFNTHPPTIDESTVQYSKIRIYGFNFTQGAAAGDAGSFAYLYRLPAGKVALLHASSFYKFSAMGTARTMDLGWAAYKDKLGTAVVADPNGIADGTNVAAAGTLHGSGGVLSNGYKEFESSTGVDITAQINDGTIPAAATIAGYLCCAVE